MKKVVLLVVALIFSFSMTVAAVERKQRYRTHQSQLRLLILKKMTSER
jgi:hypothetical protein